MPAPHAIVQACESRHPSCGTPFGVSPVTWTALCAVSKAAQRKQSLNSLILDELTAATAGVQKRADFHDLVGRWEDDPEFDETIARQRQIDIDKWK